MAKGINNQSRLDRLKRVSKLSKTWPNLMVCI